MSDQKRPKVLRVVTTSECVPWHLSNTLRRMTADFDVCVVGERVSQYRQAYPDILWTDLPMARKVNLASDLRSLISLISLIRHYKPDIVHSIMPKAGLVSALAGFICRVPVRMHTFTGQVWATKTGCARSFLKILDRLVVGLNTICLTDSPSQSLFLYHNNISLKGKPLPVLSKGSLSGVDISRFQRPGIDMEARALRQSLGIADTEFVFTFIARKSVDKGAIDTLNAFDSVVKEYPDTKLLFVGPDESNGEVKRLIDSNPMLIKNVVNVDRVDNPELYLAISDVLCLPSYREGFGSIVIDAAAMGIPAIGSNIPGLIDAIEHEKSGLLFPAGNLKEISKIMKYMINNKNIVSDMGENARRRVEQYFTADVLYEALKGLYLKLLHSQR